MRNLNLPDRPLLLDGGMGRELRSRGVDVTTAIWSATGLIKAPDIVRQIHQDYISAGADIITTNTYGIIRSNLAKEGLEEQFEALNVLACTLARQARQKSETSVLIAGSLPPLAGSYRPDLVGEVEDILPLYMEQSELLAPYVDLILCETMSSAAEARAAAMAACKTNKPVWVAWTLHEDRSGNLRSDETISLAAEFLSDLPVAGFLVNCCAPESITSAMPQLVATGADYVGGYANTCQPIPEDWNLEGDKQTDGSLDLRSDLDPESYAEYVGRWLQAGANVVGGCCGTGSAHIS
ncbi:MAG: homocysteine S-methyltransferase family protein, partial [bacterium]|nr:homocysteine S-methyltransferase family protein [bacterium]